MELDAVCTPHKIGCRGPSPSEQCDSEQLPICWPRRWCFTSETSLSSNKVVFVQVWPKRCSFKYNQQKEHRGRGGEREKGVQLSKDIPDRHVQTRNKNSLLIFFRKLRWVLTNRLLKFFQERRKKDPEKFLQFYEDYGLFFREGIVSTPEQAERVSFVATHDVKCTMLLLSMDFGAVATLNATLVDWSVREAPETRVWSYWATVLHQVI